MDHTVERNKDLIMRAIELMQYLMSPAEPPRLSSASFPEYTFPEFMHDLDSCGEEEQTILASNARALFETAIQRRMPTLWLVKTRHPVFAVYAALCERIKKPLTFPVLFLEETDFPSMTKYGQTFLRAPVHIEGIEEETSLSSALENLPSRRRPWTVLCNWRFDTWDSAVAEAFGKDGTACVLRPE